MNIFGSPWVSFGLLGSLWYSLGLLVSWLKSLFGSLLVSLSLYRSFWDLWVSWVSLDHLLSLWIPLKPLILFFCVPLIDLLLLSWNWFKLSFLLPSSAKAPTQLGWVSFSITLHNKFLDPQPESTRKSLYWCHFKPYLDEIWGLGVKYF